MELLCLRDYNYGKRPDKGEPSMREMLTLFANPQKARKAALDGEDLDSEFIHEFKAGKTYDMPADLAQRLLRDHGPIDYFAWRIAQSKTDMPIASPPKRENPSFEVLDIAALERYEAQVAAREEARRVAAGELEVAV